MELFMTDPSTKPRTLNLDEGDWQLAKALAAGRKLTISAWFRQIVREEQERRTAQVQPRA
jgi:hypothetical protein